MLILFLYTNQRAVMGPASGKPASPPSSTIPKLGKARARFLLQAIKERNGKNLRFWARERTQNSSFNVTRRLVSLEQLESLFSWRVTLGPPGDTRAPG